MQSVSTVIPGARHQGAGNPAAVRPAAGRSAGDTLVKRHRLSTRLWHWISAALMVLLLMSGLMIFNAHPRLYWGEAGAHDDPAWLEIGAVEDRGYLRLGEMTFDTTGVLGVSADFRGPATQRAFPQWATLPSYRSLAVARRWHLTLAWPLALGTLAFGIWSLINGHVRRDLMPCRAELSPRHVGSQIARHAMCRWPCGDEARHYNVLQKLVYLGVGGGLVPLVILTGLTLSPWFNSVAPWFLDIFGGRQSARSLHFIAMVAVVSFVGLHLVMVIATGPINHLRSMITGWYRIPEEKRP